MNVEVMKYYRFFKYIQCCAENKMMCLTKEFNKEMKK